jgi:hypothetical protein
MLMLTFSPGAFDALRYLLPTSCVELPSHLSHFGRRQTSVQESVKAAATLAGRRRVVLHERTERA